MTRYPTSPSPAPAMPSEARRGERSLGPVLLPRRRPSALAERLLLDLESDRVSAVSEMPVAV